MEIAELFPSWMQHEVAFFERHERAITTTARFMSNGNSWDVVVMWETLLSNCAKAKCACGMPWEEDMEQFGCWSCGADKPVPNVQIEGLADRETWPEPPKVQ